MTKRLYTIMLENNEELSDPLYPMRKSIPPDVDGPPDTYVPTESTQVPVDVASSKTAVRFNEGKLDWSLMPWDSLEEILKVLEFGKIKYSSWNWSKGEGFTYTSLFGCISRHLFAWIRGEDNDPESGLSHIAHAACNLLFLLYFIKHKDAYKNNDNRPPKI